MSSTDQFGFHEALHVASVFQQMVETHLCEHPAIQSVPTLSEKASEVASLLADLYQEISRESDRLFHPVNVTSATVPVL